MKIKRSIKRKLPKDELAAWRSSSTTWGRVAWYFILVSAFFGTGVYAVLIELEIPFPLAMVGAIGLVVLLMNVVLNNLGRRIR